MEFDNHLFISYAHIDNVPFSPEQKGWVTRFHDSLETVLSMRIGDKAIVWRDKKLAGNDIFANEIVSQFSRTALLLSVISPRYLKSEWCTREVREFLKAAEQTSGITVGNRSRIIKIIKSPVDVDDALPEVMRSVLGYQFYDFDEDDTPLELDPAFGEEMGRKYNIKVLKLAWEISSVIKSLAKVEPVVTQPAASAAGDKTTVYLAECSFDQRDARDALDAELKCHGYRVLPEKELARDEATYTKQVAALLRECQLSIHVIGNNFGAVPDGPSQKSVSVLQNELATECSREQGLRRIIWLPDAIVPRQDEQKAFIHLLKTDAEAQFGADLITSNAREAVKNAIHATLAKLKQPTDTHVATPGTKLLYLICDQRDLGSTRPLRKYLKSRGIDTSVPIFEGDAASIRQANEELLQQCDAVIVFYGVGGEAWRRSVNSDIKKIRCGAGSCFPAYTYLAAPETDTKRDLVELEEDRLLDCLASFSEAAVLPFVQAFEARHP